MEIVKPFVLWINLLTTLQYTISGAKVLGVSSILVRKEKIISASVSLFIVLHWGRSSYKLRRSWMFDWWSWVGCNLVTFGFLGLFPWRKTGLVQVVHSQKSRQSIHSPVTMVGEKIENRHFYMLLDVEKDLNQRK